LNDKKLKYIFVTGWNVDSTLQTVVSVDRLRWCDWRLVVSPFSFFNM